MIPVDQTVFGAPNGDCLPACIASILELPLAEVPHFGAEDWFAALTAWLAPRGLYPVCAGVAGDWRPAGLHILAGKSPRGAFLHAVVARGAEIVHDPHPSRAGLLSHADVTMLVPLDPADAERLAAERDEARAWVRRLTAAERVLTCAFCGEAYPPGTPESNDAALTAHVRVCAKHPMREVEAELARLRGAAAAVVLSCEPAEPIEAMAALLPASPGTKAPKRHACGCVRPAWCVYCARDEELRA